MIENALKYQALGWNIFPIKENEKAPATPNGFRDATNDKKVIEGWWNKINYNIGLSLDGICVIDIDTHNGVNGYASLAEFDMPTTVTASTPSGGRHYYFKISEKVDRKTGFRPGIDRLTNGYVLLPESVHPNGGKYQWMPERSPWDLEMAELPKAFKENKAPTPWNAPSPKPTPTQKKDIKDRAILYVQNCEPAVMGMSGHNQLIYAASALVNGFDLSDQEAINILWSHYNPMCSPPWDHANPSDRKDFERKVVEARKTCTKPRGWLIGEDKPEIAPDPLGKQIQQALLARIDKHKPVKKDDVIVYESAEKPEIIEKKMPKLLKEVRDCIEERASVPQPWLNLGGTLALFSVILGKKYKFRGQRSNLFIVNVAPTSSGKNISRDIIKKILYKAGLEDVLGGEQVTSDRALLNVVAKSGRSLFLWDEVAHMILAQNSKNASSSMKAIAPTLMTLYSSANSNYLGKDYADTANNLKAINEPHCCIMGTTTPAILFKAFTGEDAESGYMARMLFFQSSEEPEPVELPCFDDPSDDLCKKIREIGEYTKVAEGAEALLKYEGTKELECTEEAAKYLRKMQLKMHKHKTAEAEGPIKALFGKTYEIMLRVCIIATIADGKEVMDIDAVQWACELVEYLTMECVSISKQKLDSNDFRDRAMKVFEYIKKKDDGKGIPHSKLLQNLSFLSSTNELANIRKHLEDSEMIVCQRKGRGITYFLNKGATG